MDSIESVLVDQIRARNRQYRWAALLLLVLCLGGAAAFLTGFLDPTESRSTARAAVYCTLGPLLALGFFLVTLADPRRHRVIVACTQTPNDVVWHYLSAPRRQPFMSKPAWRWMAADSTLWVGLSNGKLSRCPVRFGEEERVTRAMRAAVPKATAGYSASAAATFKQNPAALRRA